PRARATPTARARRAPRPRRAARARRAAAAPSPTSSPVAPVPEVLVLGPRRRVAVDVELDVIVEIEVMRLDPDARHEHRVGVRREAVVRLEDVVADVLAAGADVGRVVRHLLAELLGQARLEHALEVPRVRVQALLAVLVLEQL